MGIKWNIRITSVFLLFYFTLFTGVLSQFRGNNFHDDEYHPDEGFPDRSQKTVDPCLPRYHRLINNQPQRSYNYRFGSGPKREVALCDRDMPHGWYRFNSLAGNTIPTSCPGINYCGTRAPVWMKGTIPGVNQGISKAVGCVSIQGNCCTNQIPMLVKNCSDFIVYHLQPTDACPSAYCAGYEVPCPAGLSSDTGYTPCHFPVDLLETKVSYGLSKDGSQVQFFCDVTLGGQVVPESVALEVEWIVDDETVQSETFGLLQQHKGVLKEEKWSIGQTLQCRARARHTSINTFTSVITSPVFNTGILILNNPVITVNEGAEPVFIEFQLSIPVTCPKKKKEKKKGSTKDKKKEEEPEEEEECCVTFDIASQTPSTAPRCANGNLFDLVVLNACTYKICTDEWNLTHRIPIWAVNDGFVGGENAAESYTVVNIDIHTEEKNNPPRWQDIYLPPTEIHITHGEVHEKCVVSDKIKTFDGVTYENHIEGTFVLYRHATLPYEIQISMKRCKQRSICICSVAIRFGEVMIAYDVCITGKLKFWGHTSDGAYRDPSKISHLPQIIRIDEGRHFEIKFPFGTRISIGPNLRFVSIQSSIPDLYHTSGLCGSFDRVPGNDFATYKGQVVCSVGSNTTNCDDFTKSWRLLAEQSLFVGAFNPHGGAVDEDEESIDESLSPGHCSCSQLKKQKTSVLRPKSKQYSAYPYDEYQPEEQQNEQEQEDSNKCQSAQCVDPRGEDVTTQFLELILDEEFAPDEKEFTAKKEPAELKPVFLERNNNELSTVKSGDEWNDASASQICQKVIENTETYKLCRELAHVKVQNHMKGCTREIMLSKSPFWSNDALEELRWECRDQVYHNLSVWEPQLGRQYGTPPLALLSSLCLNNCSGIGSCENGQCRCSRDVEGSDCSVNLKDPPIVTGIGTKNACDIREKPCSELIIWGEKFADHKEIKCHFDVYRTPSIKSVPVLGETLVSNGKLITYQAILCDIPDLPIHDAKIASFYIPGEGLDKTRTLMRVRVSYGAENPPSEPVEYVVFDSLCWICENPLRCEPKPSQSCNVLSEPFGSDPFPNPTYNSPSIGYPSDPLFGHSRNTGSSNYPQIQQQSQSRPRPHPQLSQTCELPKDAGPCRNDNLRYYYDSSASKCRPFIFGGCQGNSNNFQIEKDCIKTCAPSQLQQQIQETRESESFPLQHQQQKFDLLLRPTISFTNKPLFIEIPEVCNQGNSPGPCQDEIVRYYYDSNKRFCRPFIFGGCGGNSNNYKTKEECMKECERRPEN